MRQKCLDQRIGELNLCQRQHAAEYAATDELVDVAIEVLDAAVYDKLGRPLGARSSHRPLCSLHEHRDAVRDVKALRYPVGEYAPAEVVDDSVHVGFGSTDESDDGRVDVPRFVGPGRPQTDFGLLRMHALPGPPPAVLPDKPGPSARGSQHLAQPLNTSSAVS